MQIHEYVNLNSNEIFIDKQTMKKYRAINVDEVSLIPMYFIGTLMLPTTTLCSSPLHYTY